MNADTIVAIATPAGRGGVGIVRISGKNSLTIATQLSQIKQIKPRFAHYCALVGKDNALIDTGIVLYFKNPNSFTGEDVIEFQVHGSPIVLDKLVNECLLLGARIAYPGEFSKRAFLNNKIDLTQAEAIADLISANSLTAAKMALRSLQGDFSKEIQLLNQKIIQLRMFIEATIDFPEEEIDFLNQGQVYEKLDIIFKQIQTIFSAAKEGSLLQEGINVVIAGCPNAGKSTLINKLARKDIAIVTEIAGTTRDVIRETILIDDLLIHLSDTAGLRESEDIVEQEGIKRTYKEIEKADLILLVVDINEQEFLVEQIIHLRELLGHNIQIIVIFNKVDLLSKQTIALSELNISSQKIIRDLEIKFALVSAKSGFNLHDLKTLIKKVVNFNPQEGQFLARRRHLFALENAKKFIQNAKVQLDDTKALELIAEDLRLAHLALCEITGEYSADDLLGEIFSSFCIGK